MKIHFYIPTKAINDATQYYVDLIKQALTLNNSEVIFHQDMKFDFDKSDFFLTIRVRDFITIYLRTRSKKIMHWSQGVGPEEYLQTNNYTVKAQIVSFLFSVVEMITLRKALFNIFVSEAMHQHYERKYRQKIVNYCVIPCYNKHLNKNYFDKNIKTNLSFVYAGSLDSWQCFEKTLKLFKNINEINKNASLTLLTKDIQKAKEICNIQDVKNVNIKYVQLKDLDSELSKHQYGFLLRENNIINNVATPTKFNSYLAAGIIPIFTDVIYSFNENINLENYELKFNINDDFKAIAKKICDHSLDLNYINFFTICEQNFKNYYNDESNILLLKFFLVIIDNNSKL